MITPLLLSLRWVETAYVFYFFAEKKHPTPWGHEFCHVRVDGECLWGTIQGATPAAEHQQDSWLVNLPPRITVPPKKYGFHKALLSY